MMLVTVYHGYITHYNALMNAYVHVLLEQRKESLGTLLKVMSPPTPDGIDPHDNNFMTTSTKALNRITSGNRMSKRCEDRGVTSVLFIDVADFDMLSSHLSPQHLVALLDAFYTHIDNVIEAHSLITIETVGPEYMAMSPIQDTLYMAGHCRGAEACVMAAFDSLRILQKACVIAGDEKFHVGARAGIATGRVASGLVGQMKPQYTMIGNTVNVANRMQSTAFRMNLQITDKTYFFLLWEESNAQSRQETTGLSSTSIPEGDEGNSAREQDVPTRLCNLLEFEERRINVKGKGVLTTYFVYKKQETQNLEENPHYLELVVVEHQIEKLVTNLQVDIDLLQRVTARDKENSDQASVQSKQQMMGDFLARHPSDTPSDQRSSLTLEGGACGRQLEVVASSLKRLVTLRTVYDSAMGHDQLKKKLANKIFGFLARC